ncbi:unnamed protein product [Pleuronectes platessa]|uniref:Uncharacterized protein n=1 Tax=Pleuronectes platessa TaxID=8262 RepID=A0A9N7Y682_PLEPL|nr:unnamed protein product [Pleuronectes platessa]
MAHCIAAVPQNAATPPPNCQQSDPGQGGVAPASVSPEAGVVLVWHQHNPLGVSPVYDRAVPPSPLFHLPPCAFAGLLRWSTDLTARCVSGGGRMIDAARTVPHAALALLSSFSEPLRCGCVAASAWPSYRACGGHPTHTLLGVAPPEGGGGFNTSSFAFIISWVAVVQEVERVFPLPVEPSLPANLPAPDQLSPASLAFVSRLPYTPSVY